ncbi:potassium voltage-gated channel protein Shaw-like [Saccostrea echinata]|uniref:potassium voltage-gated channel protein Shaw-like n=1 Tax=Saccostrea echinata TaxID=191078 RepID=UPI002A80734E|nr:potassium voltage-gated channel protein Shaw-like [Saccostrea echinata]
MNVISFSVRKQSAWQDDHQHSVHNLARITRSTTSQTSENDSYEIRRRRDRTKDLFGKLKEIVTSKKYRDVDWHRIIINVGGTKFSVYNGTIRTVPGTRLANLSVKSEEYDRMNNEYFFDRNPELFPYILDFYRYGEMHIPRFICAKKLLSEMKYWGLNGSCLSHCCRKYYYDSLDEIFDYEDLQKMFETVPEKLHIVDSGSSFGDTDIRHRIWSLLNNPLSSTSAKVWSILYMTLVILSIICMFTSTLASCRVEPKNTFFQRYVPKHIAENSYYVLVPPRFTNFSEPCIDHCDTLPTHNNRVLSFLTTQPHSALLFFDLFCLIFFTTEIIFRFLFGRRRWRMLKSFTTICDILYLIPATCMFAIDFLDRTHWHNVNRIGWFLLLQTLMTLRVLRLFRFTAHYHGLKTLWLAVKASKRELFLLFIFMIMATTFFATFIFCTEFFEATSYYNNIYIGMWWSLITMTTVGYGDFYPNSALGYVLASICALTGIILMGMPVPLIARNFHSFYGLQFYHAREYQIQYIRRDEDIDLAKEVPKELAEVEKPEVKSRQKEGSVKEESKETQNDVEVIVTAEKTGEEKLINAVQCAVEKRNKLMALFEKNKVSPVNEDCENKAMKRRRQSL